MPRIIKQDGTRQPFDEEKLRAGIIKALEKRPVSLEEIDTAINSIGTVFGQRESEIKSLVLGEEVMKVARAG